MSKKALPEKFIQNTVAEGINKSYYRRRRIFIDTEVYTKLKRADVFLAFMRARNRPYTVVIEAKSRTTIHQLKLKENPDRIRWVGSVFAVALIVGLSIVLGYQWYFNALNTLLLLGVFIIGSSLITAGIRKLELSVLSSIGAIQQLARYPANEKWIAIGEDSIVKPSEYQQLRKQCKKSGVGLIVVTKGGKLRIRETPSPRHAFNNYLDKYGKEEDILALIRKKPDYGPTPAERAKSRRQALTALLLIGVVSLLSLLTYEENYGPIVPDPFEEGYLLAETAPPAEDQQEGADAGAMEGTAAGCDGFVITSRSFIVVDALLDQAALAVRIDLLKAGGITDINTTSTNCLNSWPDGNRETLYIGELYSDRPSAKKAAVSYRKALEAKGIPVLFGKPVKVRPTN